MHRVHDFVEKSGHARSVIRSCCLSFNGCHARHKPSAYSARQLSGNLIALIRGAQSVRFKKRRYEEIPRGTTINETKTAFSTARYSRNDTVFSPQERFR
jgi:hypothetical protein